VEQSHSVSSYPLSSAQVAAKWTARNGRETNSTRKDVDIGDQNIAKQNMESNKEKEGIPVNNPSCCLPS
jgi:hypothetical protein